MVPYMTAAPAATAAAGGRELKRLCLGKSTSAPCHGNPAEESVPCGGKRVGYLTEDFVVDTVMHILGEGHHIFVATVCKSWNERCKALFPAPKTLIRNVVATNECLLWAIQHGAYQLSVTTFNVAAEFGEVSILETLYGMGCPWEEEASLAALDNQRHGLSILKFLRALKHPWHPLICNEAAWRGGDVAMLCYLLSEEADAPLHEDLFRTAVSVGRINVLEVLLHHPRVRREMEAAPEYSMWRNGAARAARVGNLEVLKWLHANASTLCDWSAWTCQCAVEFAKRLDVLQWLRSEEVMCEWDGFACPQVARDEGSILWGMDGGDQQAFDAIKQWVHANGHPCDCKD